MILDKLAAIDTFIFDVDGVLTDGSVLMIPGHAPVRNFNSKDGFIIQLAMKKNYRIAIITGGSSDAVKERLNFLGVKDVFLSANEKKPVLEAYMKEHNLKPEEVLYMGDDLPDYDVMQTVGVACCPADAAPEIKAISDLIPKLILNSMDSSMIMTNFRASNDSENQLTSNINQNQNEFNEMRNEIITKLFLKLNLENDIETTNNIVNVCIELMENKSILEFIANDEGKPKRFKVDKNENFVLADGSAISNDDALTKGIKEKDLVLDEDGEYYRNWRSHIKNTDDIWKEIIKVSKSRIDVGKKVKILFVKDRPGHDMRYAIDSSKIQKELDWVPLETFETGIRKTVQWYLDNLAWCRKIQDGRYRQERLGVQV